MIGMGGGLMLEIQSVEDESCSGGLLVFSCFF